MTTGGSHRQLSGLDYHDHYGKLPPLNVKRSTSSSSHPPPKLWTFIHIPKTAGDSFLTDAPNHMTTQTNVLGNKERSLKFSDTSVPMVVFLREPTSHVLSQFLECKYDGWGQNTTKGTGFPGYHKLEDALLGFDEWVRHFHGLEKRPRFGKYAAFNCYDPFNMQARYMVTNAKSPHFATTKSDRWPDLATSRKRLAELQVVGIVEHYPASLCVFEYHAGGRTFLTDDCQVCDEEGQLKVAKSLVHHSHGVPPHSIHSISNETLELIHDMTRIDQQLYQTGLEMFVQHVDSIRHETGMDLLCRGPTIVNETSVLQGNKTHNITDHQNIQLPVTDHQKIPLPVKDIVPYGGFMEYWLSAVCIVVVLVTVMNGRAIRTSLSPRNGSLRGTAQQ
jgi:hypothetical protein